jgi:glycosyltransferase involved in cell wall biosynthesis
MRSDAPQSEPELSVVLPCLNEAETLASCLEKARKALDQNGISGELIVADNGSRDASREIAARCGARVVEVALRGYGAALAGGIEAARGRYVLMGDADDSYDFGELPRFVAALRAGADLAQGCRLPAGGGRVLPGAMPALHRWIGNPLMTAMLRRMFHVPLHDAYCGLRGFRRDFQRRLGQRCTGMEFALEMLVKAALRGARFAEVPITLHPDGRRSHGPHLRSFRDGWRSVRFFLMSSPRWLFLYPGLVLGALGLLGYALALPGLAVFGAELDAHTLLFASLFVLMGYQSVLFALLSKTFATSAGLLPENPRLTRLFEWLRLETGLLLGGGALVSGAVLLALAIAQWRAVDFGDLDYARTMRLVIPGVTLAALGFQTVLWSFFVSILGMDRR